MQLGEACAIAVVKQEEPLCNPDEVDPGNWTAVIDDIKGGVGSADELMKNMVADGKGPPDYPARKAELADLFQCGVSTFPCQTHHLIPERQLPDHPVTAWLTDAPKSKCKDKEYELAGDTSYDTNGACSFYLASWHQGKGKSLRFDAGFVGAQIESI